MITDDIKAALEGVTQWPWYFHDGGPYTHVRSQADRILICVLSWHSSIRKHHPLKPESFANTKLIAAAPDLLYRALGEIESLQAQLRTCIKKAAAEAREQMREECERLRADAERYRLIRQHPTFMGWDSDFRPDEIDAEVDKFKSLAARAKP